MAGLTLQPAAAHGGSSAPVAQQLVSEANRASAPVAVAWRTGLEIDNGPVRPIRPETEHLARAPAVGQQQLQAPVPLDEHARSAEGGRRFDAHGGAPDGGQVGFEDHPQSLARIDPPNRTLCAAQPHLENKSGVHGSCETAGNGGKGNVIRIDSNSRPADVTRFQMAP